MYGRRAVLVGAVEAFVEVLGVSVVGSADELMEVASVDVSVDELLGVAS